MPPPRYPSDLSNEEWALLEPLLASPEKRGRPPRWPTRRVANAVFYLLRSGCAWRMLPKEYPPWQTVYYHFRAGGASTVGSGERMTGCGRRCAGRRGPTGTLARA